MIFHKTRWASAAEETRLSWHQAAKPGRPARRQQMIPVVPDTKTKTERVKASSQRKHSDNEFKANRSYTMPDTVPLVTIAAEINQDASLVAARIAEHVVIDSNSGLRCVPADVCRWLIDEAARAVAASHERDRERRAALAAQSRPLRERIAARAREQARMRASGMIGPDTPAIALVAGGDKLASLDRKGRQFEAYVRGESSFVPLHPEKES